MFKFSKVYNYSLHFSRFQLLCHWANTPSDSFFFDRLHRVTTTFSSQDGWKFRIAIYALISCVDTINKTCHRVVKICNRGGNKKYGSSRQAVLHGFAASPLCVFAFKLLNINRQATQVSQAQPTDRKSGHGQENISVYWVLQFFKSHVSYKGLQQKAPPFVQALSDFKSLKSRSRNQNSQNVSARQGKG